MEWDKHSSIVLASDSRLFLEGIRKILEGQSRLKVIAHTLDSGSIQNCLRLLRPEFLLLDNRPYGVDVYSILKFIDLQGMDTKVIIFGNRADSRLYFSNVSYIGRETDSFELIKIIKGFQMTISTRPVVRPNGQNINITRMENRVIELIKEGLSNKNISERLSIKEKTVKAHITHILKKLGYQSRYQLMANGNPLRRKTG